MKLNFRNTVAAAFALMLLFVVPRNAFAATQHVTACGTVIRTSGLVLVDVDLTCSGDAIDIQASNVTLKLQGHILKGPGGSGVPGGPNGIVIVSASGAGVKNVTILGPGTVRNFNQGIYFAGTVGGGVVGVVVVSNNFAGFVLNSDSLGNPSKSLLISQNSVDSNGQGITCNALTASTIVGNSVNLSAADAIDLYAVTNTQVLGNLISDNAGGDGIQLGGLASTGSTGNTIVGNYAGNNLRGIELQVLANTDHFSGNVALGSTVLDFNDQNAGCATDTYKSDVFTTANQSCVK